MSGCGNELGPSARLAIGRRAILAATLVLVALMSACVTSRPPGGDPGNKRLDELGSDGIFAVLPPGARMSGATVRTTARYRKPGLDGGGWDGPGVTLKFTSAQSPASVFTFYADRATAFGWVATKNNVLGYPLDQDLPGRRPRRSVADRLGSPSFDSRHLQHVRAERERLTNLDPHARTRAFSAPDALAKATVPALHGCRAEGEIDGGPGSPIWL